MFRKTCIAHLIASFLVCAALPACTAQETKWDPSLFGSNTIDENALKQWQAENDVDLSEQTVELIKDLSGFNLGWELRGAVNDGDWKQASVTTALLAGSIIGPEKLLPLLKSGKTLTAEALKSETKIYQIVKADDLSDVVWDPYSRTFITNKGVIDNSKWSLDVNGLMKEAAKDKGTVIFEMVAQVKNLKYDKSTGALTLSDDFSQRLSASKNGLVYDPATDSLVPNDGSVGSKYYRLNSVIFQKADEKNLYLKTINPHRGVNNCISSAEAFNSWVNGAPATATASDLRWETYAYTMEKKYGSRFVDAMKADDIEKALSFDGATAIAFEQQWNGIWHAFNVYRDKDGIIHYVDAFFGREFTKDQLHGPLMYLKTNDGLLTVQSLNPSGFTPESAISNLKKALDDMNSAEKSKPATVVIKYKADTFSIAGALAKSTGNAAVRMALNGGVIISYDGNPVAVAEAFSSAVTPNANGGVKVSFAGNPQKTAGTLAGGAVTSAANGGVKIGNIIKPATAVIKYDADTLSTAKTLATTAGNAKATPTANGGVGIAYAGNPQKTAGTIAGTIAGASVTPAANGGVSISYAGNPQKTAGTIAGNAVTPNANGGVNIGKVVNTANTTTVVNTSTKSPVNPNPGPVPKGTTAQQVEATGGSWGGWSPGI